MSEKVLAGTERDFSKAPEAELKDLFTIPEYAPIEESYRAYTTDLREAGYEDAEVGIIAHAVGSYLDIQQSRGNENIAAQSIVMPTIDPYTTCPEGEKETLIGTWERLHSQRNATRTDEVIQRMAEADAGGETVARVSFGGMFSAKTDELLEIATNSQHRLPGVTVISPFIAGVMDEKYIMSRRGGKGRGHNAEEIRRMRAVRVNYAQIQRQLLKVVEHKNGSRNLAVIDEISFIPKDETEAEALVTTLLYLGSERIHTESTGLDTNYRDEPLAFAVAVDKIAPWMRVNNEAFFAYYDSEGKVRYRGGATKTMRHLTRSGFVDLTLPVPIGRVHANLLRYSAQSADNHIFTVLTNNDIAVRRQLEQVRERFSFEQVGGVDDHRLFSFLTSV